MVGKPVVSLLFERGAFEAASTDAVAWALAFFALGLLGHAGLEIVARAFYALHDTFTPVWVGGLAMALNVALSLILPPIFASAQLQPFGGLALANSIATLLEFGLLLLLIRQRMKGIEERRMAKAFVRSGLAALAMGLALLGWQAVLPNASALVRGGGGIAVGLTTYLGAAFLLRCDELKAIVRLARR
jgi:putative peptidoglycan lipid II flippase